MKRAPRPKVPPPYLLFPLAIGALWPLATRAQVPMSSTYATRDGRIVSSVFGCASTDGSFTAQPCGVAGSPLHVQVDAGAGTVPTTTPGAAANQVVGVQGAGVGALPVGVAQVGVWTLALPNGAHVALDAGGNVIGGVTQSGAWSVAVSNLPTTQAVSAASLPLPTGAATAANQPIRNADGGAQVHVMNPPATQAVTAASLPLPSGAATSANQPALHADGGALVHLTNPAATQAVTGSVSVANFPASQTVAGSVSISNLPATQAVSGTVSVANLPATQAISATALPLPSGAATAASQPALNADGGSQMHLVNALPPGANTIGTVVEANRSAAWTDASVTATATATSPPALAAVSSRTGLHVWNIGSATACLNYTAAAAANGGGCAPGSVPIPAGSAYLEDQPGNVSPEAISLVCAGASCPLTIKVR